MSATHLRDANVLSKSHHNGTAFSRKAAKGAKQTTCGMAKVSKVSKVSTLSATPYAVDTFAEDGLLTRPH